MAVPDPVNPPASERDLSSFAGRVAIATLVATGILVALVAVWEARLVVALLFVAIILSAALRPGVEWLAAHRVPRGLGVVLHYAALVAVIAVGLWFVVPAATGQVETALGDGHALRREARQSTGIKHDILIALDRKLSDLPAGSQLIDPAVEYGRKAFEGIVATFFVLAASAYWIVERDRAVGVVCSLLPRPKRKPVRDTWDLIELRLGAFVRGQAVLVALVATVLSAAFWAIGLPYWLLVGVFAGVVEIVPVIGPLAAGVVAIGVGLSQSVHLAVLAGIVVVGVRLLEDYVVLPRVLGHSVGLSPLVVLVSVTTVGLVLGGFAVILAVPLASILVTLIDIVVRDKDPAEEPVPAVLFPAKDLE
ncbi:MAG TPA: AI-2E family transporter [Gaiella sp.]|nr:AI-2E family transporter [Gaiella sp.]